jgi:hypothetical protein
MSIGAAGGQVTEYRMTAADEGVHVPSGDMNFNESVYVNGFDPVARIGGWMRLGNRAHEAHAELSLCFYLPDGRIACQFRRPSINDNARFAAGGMAYRVAEPLQTVVMQYSGDVLVLDDPELLRDPGRLFADAPRHDCAVELELTGLAPIHGGEPTTAGQETMYGRDFSLGHFFQHMRTRGTIRIGGDEWKIDGLGWRDHSWGPRHWSNIHYYRLFIANFGEGRGITALKITDRAGTTRRRGVLHIDGRLEEITDFDLITDWTDQMDPRSMRLALRTAKRAAVLEGEVLTLAPLRNRRKLGDELLVTRIAEGLTQWRWGEHSGLGISEYIERIEDGSPVGFPL